MTVDEFIADVRETFNDPDFRICAFRVRAVHAHSTLTKKRGEMPGMRANKIQREACAESVRVAKEKKPKIP